MQLRVIEKLSAKANFLTSQDLQIFFTLSIIFFRGTKAMVKVFGGTNIVKILSGTFLEKLLGGTPENFEGSVDFL